MSARELTTRERQLVDLLAEGLPNRAIADRLQLAPGTVGKYLSYLYQKTGATRLQLALRAAEEKRECTSVGASAKSPS